MRTPCLNCDNMVKRIIVQNHYCYDCDACGRYWNVENEGRIKYSNNSLGPFEFLQSPTGTLLTLKDIEL